MLCYLFFCVWCVYLLLIYKFSSRNLGQKIVEKFSKLRKMFFYGIFLVEIWQFFSINVKTSILGDRLGSRILGILLKFPNLLRSKSEVVWKFVKQLVYSLSSEDNLDKFHLWEKEIMLKRTKVNKQVYCPRFSILCVSQEGFSLIESNQQICDFCK